MSSFRSAAALLVMLTLGFLSGCGRGPLEGQIYLVTETGEARRLASVPIYSVDERELLEHLRANEDAFLQKQRSQCVALTEGIPVLVQQLITDKNKMIKAQAGVAEWEAHALRQESNEYTADMAVTSRELVGIHEEDLAKARNRHNAALSAISMIIDWRRVEPSEWTIWEGALPDEPIVKSDIDGKFEVDRQVIKGKGLLAVTSLTVGRSDYVLRWLISDSLHQQTEALLLDSDNLLEPSTVISHTYGISPFTSTLDSLRTLEGASLLQARTYEEWASIVCN